MTTIGNCFALLILAITMIVFFSIKYHITKASLYYTICLITTLTSAIVNILRIEVTTRFSLSPWLIKLCVTVDFAFMLLTTSVLAIYLVAKICEHNIGGNHLLFAKLTLTAIYLLLCAVLILNLPLGFIFSSSQAGVYKEGVIPFLPYLFIIPQTLLILAYCIKYRKRLIRNVRIALLESLIIVLLSLSAKLLYREISVFILSIVLIELIFFLNFQNHRIGVNSLTNLNGSRSFFQEVNKRIKSETKFKAYLIKLQNLSVIRQNYGHRMGDEVLYLFAFNLDKLFSGASAFNLHGATFALVLPCSSETASAEENEKLLSFLETPVNYTGSPMKLDYILSEYVWNGEHDADTVYEQLEHASDIARDTKVRYTRSSPELEKTRLRRQYLINRIQTVSSENGFEIWFQPIFSVGKNAFSSMEVLLRLKEEDGTYVSPAEFIPLAEKTGHIIPITWFVIEESCRALSSCKELKGKRVSINLPMIQLTDPAFDKKLNEIVDRYDVAHSRISFEFTERVIIDDLSLAEKNMRRLARSGYTFYLDDFGTGYSNFNCVLKLPLKTVKLDMSLTSTVMPTQKNNNLVYILTDLFHDMGLNVVAEGAETEEQVEMLRSFRVDGIQGYYFAKPMPLDKLKDFLKNQKKPEHSALA